MVLESFRVHRRPSLPFLSPEPGFHIFPDEHEVDMVRSRRNHRLCAWGPRAVRQEVAAHLGLIRPRHIEGLKPENHVCKMLHRHPLRVLAVAFIIQMGQFRRFGTQGDIVSVKLVEVFVVGFPLVAHILLSDHVQQCLPHAQGATAHGFSAENKLLAAHAAHTKRVVDGDSLVEEHRLARSLHFPYSLQHIAPALLYPHCHGIFLPTNTQMHNK